MNVQQNLPQLNPESHPDTVYVVVFILKGTGYAVYALFIALDGLRFHDSFELRVLTLPYLIGGLALVRSWCCALDEHHVLHAFLFALGLSTLGAMA